MIYIMAMVFTYEFRLTSIQAEYTSKEKCEQAVAFNRQALSSGKVILATCTPK